MTAYDGIAQWYDEVFATSELGRLASGVAVRLVGPGPGRLLDMGCGGGLNMLAAAEAGWTTSGVDVSEGQLRLARERGCDVVRADCKDVPFDGGSFDAGFRLERFEEPVAGTLEYPHIVALAART